MPRNRATIDDVARVAGVSVATVSRALRNRPNVAEATRARVVQAAARLGYSAHRAASSLASGRTHTIGMAAPFYGIWYTAKVAVGVLSVLAEAGYDLEVYAVDTPEHQADFIDRVSSLTLGVDGLLLIDFYGDAEQLDRLTASGMTVVSLGEELEAFPSVSIDNRAAAREATEHLIRLGHSKIALLGADAIRSDGSPVLVDRFHGYAEAMRDAGLEIGSDGSPGSGRRRFRPMGALTVGAGAAAVDAVSTLSDPPTAVFCLSDEFAMGAIGRARELGMDIPGDLSVVGFDDHDLAAAFGLTTIRQPVQELGVQIARRMLDLVEAVGEDAGAADDHTLVPVELVVRDSTAPPRAAANLSP